MTDRSTLWRGEHELVAVPAPAVEEVGQLVADEVGKYDVAACVGLRRSEVKMPGDIGEGFGVAVDDPLCRSRGAPMRVALVLRQYPAISETFIVRKFVDLAERGLDLHVVADRIDHDLWAAIPALAARPHLAASIHGLPLDASRWRAGARAGIDATVGACRHPPLARRHLTAFGPREAARRWSMARVCSGCSPTSCTSSSAGWRPGASA